MQKLDIATQDLNTILEIIARSRTDALAYEAVMDVVHAFRMDRLDKHDPEDDDKLVNRELLDYAAKLLDQARTVAVGSLDYDKKLGELAAVVISELERSSRAFVKRRCAEETAKKAAKATA